MLTTYHFHILKKDDELNDLLLEALSRHFGRRPGRSRAHIAPLSNPCLRQAAYYELNPQEPDMKTMFSWLLGEAAHQALQILAPYIEGGAIREHQVETYGVKGHIDLFLVEPNAPVEIKTTRSRYRQINEGYIQQLKYYMTSTDNLTGFLIILYLLETKDVGIESYRLEITEDELVEQKLKLKSDGDLFNAALKNRMPAMLPHVKFNPQMNWKCGYCPFKRECYDISD